MSLNAKQKRRQFAASLLLGAVVCGACMAALPVLWPALLGVASHGLLVVTAALSGAVVLGMDAHTHLCADRQYSAKRAVCLALVMGLAAVPIMSSVSVGVLWLQAAVQAAAAGVSSRALLFVASAWGASCMTYGGFVGASAHLRKPRSR